MSRRRRCLRCDALFAPDYMSGHTYCSALCEVRARSEREAFLRAKNVGLGEIQWNPAGDAVPPATLLALAEYMRAEYVGCIYGLIDPREPHVVAYVGMTMGHVFGRYLEHIRDGAAGKARPLRLRWLAEVLGRLDMPGLTVLERGVNDARKLRVLESTWIRRQEQAGGAWVNQGKSWVIAESINRTAAVLSPGDSASEPVRVSEVSNLKEVA